VQLDDCIMLSITRSEVNIEDCHFKSIKKVEPLLTLPFHPIFNQKELFTHSYDFELVLAKKPVIFLCTLSLSQ
jgi:hypothetical protein